MSGAIQRVKRLDEVQIAAIAQNKRTLMGLVEGSIADPFVLLDLQLSRTIRSFDVFVVDDEELPHAYAEYRDSERHVIIRNSVAERAANGDGRARWTLFHEAGHAILHQGQLRYAAQRVERKSAFRPLPKLEDSDWQADQFAKHVLMPTRFCASCGSPGEIVSHCGVSEQAAQIRFLELSELRRSQWKE